MSKALASVPSVFSNEMSKWINKHLGTRGSMYGERPQEALTPLLVVSPIHTRGQCLLRSKFQTMEVNGRAWVEAALGSSG